MKIKQAVKKAALRAGMDMCGIAGIDRFSTSPPGKHPQDILPGCRSVIVVGVRLLDGVIQANFRDFEDGRSDLKGIYGTYGYSMLPNFELTYAATQWLSLLRERQVKLPPLLHRPDDKRGPDQYPPCRGCSRAG